MMECVFFTKFLEIYFTFHRKEFFFFHFFQICVNPTKFLVKSFNFSEIKKNFLLLLDFTRLSRNFLSNF